MQASPSMGLNGSAEIYDIYAQANRIDTVRFNMVSQDNQLKYTAQVRNAPGNPQYVFNALPVIALICDCKKEFKDELIEKLFEAPPYKY